MASYSSCASATPVAYRPTYIPTAFQQRRAQDTSTLVDPAMNSLEWVVYAVLQIGIAVQIICILCMIRSCGRTILTDKCSRRRHLP